MLGDWTCPNCKAEHDAGQYPDHWSDGRRFTFECDCGASFEIDVDWSPTFYVMPSTVVVTEKKD